MRRIFLILVFILGLGFISYSQINLAAYNSMHSTIKVEEGWARTDLFTMEFYSEIMLFDPAGNSYRKLPGFQATLVFNTNTHGAQVLALLDWFKVNNKAELEFKLWSKTAKAKCRIYETTHNNGIVNIKVVGLETLKY